MVNVVWDEAFAYAQWANVWLPTESQWEKAARGTDGRKYPWGEMWDPSRCAHSENQLGDLGSTKPVGSYPSGGSPYGALDMAGNVWEWCADWYDAEYYRISPLDNPEGPSSGQLRVLRGGSWCDIDARSFRVANRRGHRPFRYVDFGFRCCCRPVDGRILLTAGAACAE